MKLSVTRAFASTLLLLCWNTIAVQAEKEQKEAPATQVFLRNNASSYHSGDDNAEQNPMIRGLQGKDDKVEICQFPPGNPENFHTIEVSSNILKKSKSPSLTRLEGNCNEHCGTICTDENLCTEDFDAELGCEGIGCYDVPKPISCDDEDPCTINTCEPAVGCVTEPKCGPGYSCSLGNCSDIDECESGTDSCDTNADCTNTIGSYDCACKTGFSGNGFSCSDIDECSSSSLNNCHPDAICSNTVGSFGCTCKPGYEGNGVSCTKIFQGSTINWEDSSTSLGNSVYYPDVAVSKEGIVVALYECNLSHDDLCYNLGKKEGNTISWYKKEKYDNGVNVAVAIHTDGKTIIDCHNGGGNDNLYYNLGRFRSNNSGIDWYSIGNKYDTGKRITVVVFSDGTILDIHSPEKRGYATIGKNMNLYYNLGKLKTDKSGINWSVIGKQYDKGMYPSATVLKDGVTVVEVHQSDNGYELFYNVGINKGTSIDWVTIGKKYDSGTDPSITAANDGTLIEVHYDRAINGDKRLYYNLGRLNSDGKTINWSQSGTKYFDGRQPAVAMFPDGRDIAEVHLNAGGANTNAYGLLGRLE